MTFVNESGESTLLVDNSSPAYVMSPFERLTLAGAEVQLKLAEVIDD